MISDIRHYNELKKLKSEYEFTQNEVTNIMKCKVVNQFHLINLRKKKDRLMESISLLQDILYKNITA